MIVSVAVRELQTIWDNIGRDSNMSAEAKRLYKESTARHLSTLDPMLRREQCPLDVEFYINRMNWMILGGTE
jgi:hypothetical protein